MRIIIDLLRGVSIGLANIIPGVSGGTMALILGMYERLIKAVRNISARTIVSPLKGKQVFIEEMKRVDALFLGCIGVGAIVAVVAAAKLLVYLLNHQHDPTYGFFFGLVLVSVVVPFRMLKKVGPIVILTAILGTGAVVGVTVALSGEKRVESAKKKVALKAKKEAAKKKAAKDGNTKVEKKYSVTPDAGNLVMFLIAGAVAISAMILPGISGSFVLLLMGVYFDVLACINERNAVMLGVFAVGCLLGLALFTRLINFLLERFHDATVSFLGGLVIGSLYAIWPFKTFEIVANQRVDKDNILPTGFGQNELLTIATTLAGCFIVGVFVVIEIRQEKRRARLKANAEAQ
jgi:putative membrane protein